MKLENASAFLCLAIAMSLAGAACATKSHLRDSVAPIRDQAGETRNQINQTQNGVRVLKDQADQQGQRIVDLDRRLAAASEKAADARTRSAEALEVARRAIDTASEAGRLADTASATAQQAQSELIRSNQMVDGVFHRPESYRLILIEKIYFAFGQSALAKEEQSKLAGAVQKIRGTKNSIIEIEGFADSSGDIQANRKLSRKRADAVAHYLVVEQGVPLRSIWAFGAGADFPHTDNQTPAARRENRRVDLKIYSLNPGASVAAAGDRSQP